MLGFVGLLSSALAAVVNVFVVMLLSFLQAQMAPTEGEYKLATENGLVFPIETHIVNDEVFAAMMETYHKIYGNEPAYISASCVIGGVLDAVSAKRYATYNYIYLKRQNAEGETKWDIAQVDSLPIVERDSKLSNMCFVSIKTKELYEQTIKHNKKKS